MKHPNLNKMNVTIMLKVKSGPLYKENQEERTLLEVLNNI